MRFTEIWRGFNYFPKQADRAVQITQLGANRTQAVLCLQERGIKPQSCVILSDSLARPVYLLVGQPKMKVRIRQAGLKPSRLLKFRNRFVQLAGLSQNDANVVARDSVIRILRDRRAKLGQSLLQMASLQLGQAQLLVRSRAIGVPPAWPRTPAARLVLRLRPRMIVAAHFISIQIQRLLFSVVI